jgi:hypothetical protein
MNEIIRVIEAVFDTVDAKQFDDTEALFSEVVAVDFTSLNGGGPATMSRSELVEGWRQGLHPKKTSFHMVGHHRVDIQGDSAAATMEGYAFNLLDEDLGGG